MGEVKASKVVSVEAFQIGQTDSRRSSSNMVPVMLALGTRAINPPRLGTLLVRRQISRKNVVSTIPCPHPVPHYRKHLSGWLKPSGVLLMPLGDSAGAECIARVFCLQ